MNPADFNGSVSSANLSGEVKWSSPSNIALTKYWGKHGDQLPRNPSVSFTLSEAKTITTINFKPSSNTEDFDLTFYFEGRENQAFGERIKKFLLHHEASMPYLRQFQWTISSENTFPHSSGIASSASAMSCLVMGLIDIERRFLDHEMTDDEALRRASFLSRLASGSASRSVYPGAALWGSCPGVESSSDTFAIPVSDWLHPTFASFHDDIIIVSDDEKAVSSSAGHQLMENNPFRQVRFDQAVENTKAMKVILEKGDLEGFIRIVESEALTLHALMMTSEPSYILMEPGTLSIIKALRRFRRETDVPITFTLDAGPNVHVLYPHEHQEVCDRFIREELKRFSTGTVIRDRVGEGPQRMA